MAQTGIKLIKPGAANNARATGILPIALAAFTPFLRATLANRPEIIFSYILQITSQEKLARASADCIIFSIAQHRDAEFSRKIKMCVNDSYWPISFDFVTKVSDGTTELMKVSRRLKISQYPTITGDGDFQFHEDDAVVLVDRLADHIPFLIRSH